MASARKHQFHLHANVKAVDVVHGLLEKPFHAIGLVVVQFFRSKAALQGVRAGSLPILAGGVQLDLSPFLPSEFI
jgi:hypothetical protein